MSTHQATKSLKNAESSACQSSGPQVSSGHRDEGKNQSEITLSVSFMQTIYREQTNDIGVIQDETSNSALLLDGQCSRSNREGNFEDENVFQTEDMLQSCVHVAAGSTRYCENKEESSSLCLDNDENDSCNVVESRSSNVQPQPEILLQPLSLRAESSRSLSSSKEELGAIPHSSAHFIKSPGTREHFNPTAEHGIEEIGANPPWSARSIKPTDTGQHSSPTSERGRENRDIFGTGEEQSLYPPAGASCTSGEEIEHLPIGESPENQIVISPSLSDEPRVNLCMLSIAFLWRWFGFLKQRICRQFAKAPFFYLVSTLILMISINTWDRITTDRDISLAIFVSFWTFIAITLLFERGQFSHIIGGWNSCIPECKRGCGNADSFISWCCCRSHEPQFERHSQYRHLPEDGAFKHEIADVSSLDPKDCPQMKMVEQRDYAHADSPDYQPEVSQVNVDVHVGKRDGEKLGASRKHLRKAAAHTTKPHKTRSDRPRSGHTKTFTADIHAPDDVVSESPLSPIREMALEDEMQNGEGQLARSDSTCTTGTRTSRNLEDASSGGEDVGNGGFCKTKKSSNPPIFPGNVLKKCSPTLPRFANISTSDSSSEYFQAEDGLSTSAGDESLFVDPSEVSDDGEFMCEHYGQSVACSCPTLL